MELLIINLIFSAISNGMDQHFTDEMKVSLHLIKGAKVVLEDTLVKIGKKQFYSQSEFAIFCLKLSIDNIEKTSNGGFCIVNIRDWYEECGNLQIIAKE